MRGLFQTARTISTIDPTALTGTPGGPSPSPGWNVRSMVQMFVRTVVRMRVIVSYSLLFISILLNIFVRILVFCLTLFFLVLFSLFFCFVYPLTVLRHADKTALFQRFAVVCFLNLLTPLLVCIVITNNRLGSQPSKVGTVSTPRHLQPAVVTGR